MLSYTSYKKLANIKAKILTESAKKLSCFDFLKFNVSHQIMDQI